MRGGEDLPPFSSLWAQPDLPQALCIPGRTVPLKRKDSALETEHKKMQTTALQHNSTGTYELNPNELAP